MAEAATTGGGERYGAVSATLQYYLSQPGGYDTMMADYQANPLQSIFQGFREQLELANANPQEAADMFRSIGIEEVEGQEMSPPLARKWVADILDDLTTAAPQVATPGTAATADKGTYDYVKGMDTKDTATKLREIWVGTSYRGIPILVWAGISLALIFAGWGLAQIDLRVLNAIAVPTILAGLVMAGATAIMANIKRNDIDRANGGAPLEDEDDGEVDAPWYRRVLGR